MVRAKGLVERVDRFLDDALCKRGRHLAPGRKVSPHVAGVSGAAAQPLVARGGAASSASVPGAGH